MAHAAPAGIPQTRLLVSLDRALRAVFAPVRASRPTPGGASAPLDEQERRLSAALMRVNHAGEVAAQGLYHGQALVARDPATRDLLEQSAREEADHLAWCETRLAELGSRPSLLQPLWYAGSFAIGAVAGLSSDPVSLGFVAETERLRCDFQRSPPASGDVFKISRILALPATGAWLDGGGETSWANMVRDRN